MNETAAPDQDQDEGPRFALRASPGFQDWLNQRLCSLAVTTYQAGKLLFFGTRPDGGLWHFNRNIGRCLGLALTGNELWVSADHQVFRMIDALTPGTRGPGGEDGYYLPQQSWFTGDIDTHDMAISGDGRVLLISTRFNCLAALSPTHSFTPVWRPPFISALAGEDRCHLNGLAMRDGKPAFATAVSTSDTLDGWREGRRDGGVVIDIASNRIVARGLSMPHSPRWHDGRLWLHDSGTGRFGSIDMASGRFEPVAFLPGYLRGLAFAGNQAVMGLSRPRGDDGTFSGLALDDELAARGLSAECGLAIVDLGTGAVTETLFIDGVVRELYDVAILPGRRQPGCLGPLSPELKSSISLP